MIVEPYNNVNPNDMEFLSKLANEMGNQLLKDKLKNRMIDLISKLNEYRNAYYNENKSLISDYEYDALFDELQSLEKETGIVFSNSPTVTVGYTVQSELKEVEHEFPLLSLDKTKSYEDIKSFLNKDKKAITMLKLDGLTCCLTYDNGVLTKAETRGNGIIGEDITENAKTFINVPLEIPYKKHYVVAGEAIIKIDKFNEINSKLPDDKKYKTPRNLVSGSVRQLDSKICAERGVEFIVWDILCDEDGFVKYDNELYRLLHRCYVLGFDVVDMLYCVDLNGIEYLRNKAKEQNIPIDGMVIKYNDLAYGASLGKTEHHFKNAIAYKFYDEEVTTRLKEVEWSIGRTGVLTPVAIFDPVEIDGTEVARASLHNISIVEDLALGVGDEISVYKANQIIPQIKENFTKSNTLEIPKTCPNCNQPTEIVQDNDTKVLKCTNPKCKGKLLGELTHFVSKPCFNIKGLSEATLKTFIDLGWVTEPCDIFNLYHYSQSMKRLDGFGDKSVDKLLDAIEKSKIIKFENFINALGIPLIGKTASKAIANNIASLEDLLHITDEDFQNLDGFGETMINSLKKAVYTEYSRSYINALANICDIKYPPNYDNQSIADINPENIVSCYKKLKGLTFVITGKLNKFANRDELVNIIESNGGKVASSVSKTTHYLINNDVNSTSGKNKKAKELNVPIISEDDFQNMLLIEFNV